jgi:uncharacterized protein (TIGR00251 family)
VTVVLESHPRGVIVPVRAHAGARRNGILGTRDGMLRVAVTAAPEKGKANRAIVEVLSDALGVAKSSIELASGDTSPQKRFLIVGGDADAVRRAIEELLRD